MRHEDHCNDLKGITATCCNCTATFTTQDIVNNALNTWNTLSGQPGRHDKSFPIGQAQMDIFAMRHMYDIHASKIQYCLNISRETHPCCLKHHKQARQCILNLRFNEHDWQHRPSCFKKGVFLEMLDICSM